MELKDCLLKRRSVRQFKNESISDDIINELLIAAMSGPSALNLCPYEFYVIKNKEVINKIGEARGNSSQKPSLIILVCANYNYTRTKDDNDWFNQDLSAAIENILLRVTDLGLGACWCGIYPRMERVEAISKLLELESNILPFAVINIGYPDEIKEERTQFDSSKVHYIE